MGGPSVETASVFPLASLTRAMTRLILPALVLAALLLPAAMALAPSPPSVTASATPSTVVPGNKVNLVAGMPVSDAGTISQQIVVQIDPTKVKLTSAADITAPSGWAITYCSTTCTSPPTNFTGTAPATAAEWAAVKAVRAVGDVNSQGEFQGRQLAARTATMAIPASGPFATSGTGDGWNVFFDDRGNVFNVFHHQTANASQVDCRDRNGVHCSANWPYGSGTGVGYTSYVSNGWYDPVYKHLWFDATRKYDVVFECIDVADVKAPKPCGGSAGTTFVRTGISKSPIAGTPNFGSFNTWSTRGIAQVGGRVFSQANDGNGPKVTCVDTQANGGLGAKCPGSPFAAIPGQTSDYIGAVAALGGKIWVTGSNLTPQGGLMCLEAATLQACSGSWPQTWSMAAPGSLFHVFDIPTAAGASGGVCVTTAKCFSPAGASVTLNSGLATWYDAVGDAFNYAEHALRQGSRLYRGNGNGAPAGAGSKTFSCWDQSLSSGAGGVCANWPIAVTNYGIALDPLNDNCVWKNDHNNAIKAYDARTATEGCTTPPSKVVIPADVAVPRMACASPGSGVREWRSIKLLAPAASGYTSAKLTILDSSGNAIPGWVDVAFDPVASRVIDLTSLTVATTGQKPTFIVQYAGLTSATNTSVEVVAVGDAPEMCLTPEAVSSCPVSPAPGQIPNSSANGSFAMLADGSATTGGGTNTYSQGSTTVTVGAGPSPSCSASLSGQALSNDASALPVAGVTVTLLDSAGTVLNWPAGSPNAGQPMTATTDADGNYAFPLLSPATYKVKFSGAATQTAKNSRLIASSAGPGASTDYTNGSGSAAASSVTSPATAIAVGGPGVVNGYFNQLAQGVADTTIGPAGQAQTSALTANDLAATGSTMSATTVYLCPAGAAAPYNAATCTLRPTVGAPITVANVGTYSLDATTGVITFTPVANFSGTAAALHYIARDVAGNVVDSTYTPTVVPAPTVTANTSTGNWDTNQTISVLANDSAGTGATLTASTVKLCPTNATSPYTASNCNQSSISVSGEGTYTANADGTVTFDPLPGFRGTVATPVRYVVQDSYAQVGSATITPTVNPPTAPVATPESQAVIPGGTATFSNLITGGGALATGTGLQTGNSNGPCLVDPFDSVCKATFTIAGEGTWTVNRSTGVATFVAAVGASAGTKTPVTYKVTDVVGQTATSTLTPVVPLPPTAGADTSTGNWDTNQTISPLANDSASPPATLSNASLAICTTATATGSCTGTTLTISGEGTYTVNNNGTITFDPVPGFAGTATPIKYVVADSTGQVATSTVTPTVNPPTAPVATPESQAVIPGGTATFSNLITGGGALATGTGLQTGNSNGPCLVDPFDSQCKATFTIAGEGTWTVNRSTGVATFVADPGVTPGTKTAVTYMVTDVVGQTATSTLTPVVPLPPTAGADTSTGNWDTNQTISPLANDSASPPATLSNASLAICTTATATGSCTGTTLTISGEGTYTVNNNGTITFDPVAGFTGAATPIKYVVADTTGQVATSTITPTVNMPAPPVATPESQAVLPGQTATFTSVLAGQGALASGADLQTGPTHGPCLVDPADSQCKASFTIAGEGVWAIDQTTGVATFVADPAATGPQTVVTYRVTDIKGQTATSTLTPVIPPPPTAGADTSTGNWDTNQTISPLANDSASPPATLSNASLAICTTATATGSCTGTTLTISGEGTYTVNNNGTITFDPVPGFAGTATPIKYVVADSTGQVATSTITPTVNAPTAPSAGPEQKQVVPGGTATFTSVLTGAGALASGTGLQTGPTHGPCLIDPADSQCKAGFTITGEGVWAIDQTTGVPTFNADVAATSGTKTAVTYRVTDAVGQTATSTLTPIIPGPPSAVADASTGGWDADQVIGILLNDSAATGTTLVPGSVGLCPINATSPYTASNCNQSSVNVSGEGTYTVNNDGTVTFNPLASFSGTVAHPVRYVVQDSLTQVASALITPQVTPPGAPTAGPESRMVLPGDTATYLSVLTALASGSGLQTGPTHGPCLIDPADSQCKAGFTITGEGTWAIDQTTGVATFTADVAATSGTKTAVTYRVTDAVGQTATSTLTPIVPVPPAATPDTSLGVVDVNQLIRPLLNDTADAATPLEVVTVNICTTATADGACSGNTLSVSGEGTYTANGDGSVTFDPLPGFTGTATPIKYVVEDSVGRLAASTITPQVVSIPAPVAADDVSTGLLNRSQSVLPMANDTPGSAAYPLDPTTVLLCGPSDVAPACTQTTLTTGDGTYTVNALTGRITFQPVNGFVGTAQAITYAITDGAGQQASANYTPTVVGVGPPQVTPATVTVESGTPGTMTPQVTPGTAAVDPSLTCLAAPGTASCAAGATSLTRPEGTYTLDVASGIVTFTPASGYAGTPGDPPSLCVTDVLGQSACATLTPTVLSPPAPPVRPDVTPPARPVNPMPGAPNPAALPDVESTLQGQPVALSVLGNDSASSGAMLDPSSVRIKDPASGVWGTSVIVPGQGSWTVSADGTLVFAPEPGFVGTTVALEYRVNDSLGRTTRSTATVVVHDTPPPWADPLFGQAMRGQPVAFDPISANTAGGSPFVPSSVRIKDPATGQWTTRVVVPGQGTWTVDPTTGHVTFQPLRSFVGAATPLAYRITNRRGDTASSTLNPVIRSAGPALTIRTTTSRAVLRPGQRATITLRIRNAGMATTKATITRAPIPAGFAVVNPMGGTVRGGWIRFSTGNLKAGGSTTRRFVLVATAAGTGKGAQPVTGWATSTNTRSVNDPTALRVIGAVTTKAPVTG